MIRIKLEEPNVLGYDEIIEVGCKVLESGALRWVLTFDGSRDYSLTDRDAAVLAAALLRGPFSPVQDVPASEEI